MPQLTIELGGWGGDDFGGMGWEGRGEVGLGGVE